MARLIRDLPAMRIFTFRLPQDEADALKAMAKLTHQGNTSDLLREMIGASCSGNPERVAQFNERIFGAVGRQLTLDMVERANPAKKPNKPNRRAKRRARP